MNLIPPEGEAMIVTDGTRYFVVAELPKRTAENGARALKHGDITASFLSSSIANSIDLLAMPGRLKRATL